MGVWFVFVHFLSTLYSQFCSYRPCTTLPGSVNGGVCQEIRHHTIKNISYTLTSNVHFTSIKQVTMCILFGITHSQGLLNTTVLLFFCAERTVQVCFLQRHQRKEKGKYSHYSLSNLATVQVTSHELFHNSDYTFSWNTVTALNAWFSTISKWQI